MTGTLPKRLRLALLVGGALFTHGGTPVVAQSATQALLEKAHTLEARGRIDMAAQSWQQVLLAEPNNTEALSGLARAAKLSGNLAQSNAYLERLRAINPNDPGLARAEHAEAEKNNNATLQQAAKLAESGQYAQAMTLYRKVFNGAPPAGDWALAYYETEAATEQGRPHAVAGLKSLVDKYPNDSRYQIALGRILTYNPKTRAEGRRYLERHPASPEAMKAVHESLVWDSQNPAAAADLRAYLAKHNDPQLAEALRKLPKQEAKAAEPRAEARTEPRAESRPATRTLPHPSAPRAATGLEPETAESETADAAPEAAVPTGPSPEVLAARQQGAEMQAAYKALNAKHPDEAEARFKEVLAKEPNNAQALAGIGYIRMQQGNFGAAISFLDQAKQNGEKDPGLDTALETARFWSTMNEGATALNSNDLTTAEQQYQAALALRPSSSEALEGLGGTLLKAQQPEAAITVFERFTRAKPNAPQAWRGLFLAYYGAGNSAGALATERRIPSTVHAQLMHDPDFLRTLASAYSAVGRDADAQRVLRSALDQPFPEGAAGLKIETQLQYAALLQQANHLDQAAGLYRQVLATDMANAAAWQGLIRANHAMKQDAQAVQALESMPPSAYETAIKDPGFQMTIASVYQETHRLDQAQAILEKAVQAQVAANQKPSVGLELQLAGLYLARNNPQQAYPIYREVLSENPDRPDAWKGLLAVLHGANRDQEALAQAQNIPAGVRHQLENDPQYLQTIGSVYNALGQPQQAMVFINRVQQHYASQNTAAPSDVDIQDAWLLFNGGNDAGLYRQLMMLGGRPDLSDEQRRNVQTIWTNWAVRRANQAAGAGDQKRSLAILNAAAKAFPDNPGVLRALASGYARAGLAKQAVLIFKSQDMTAATSSDYKSAIGAALAAGDQKSAETWLRYGLDAYPKDAQMLTLGAKFEQAHGNSSRAADYFRASLAALPPGDPGAELAGELSQPMTSTRLPSATQSQDLATLLSQGASEPLPGAREEQGERPYLPNFGNTSGQAPVQLGPSAQLSGSGYASRSSVVPPYMSNPSRLGTQPAATSVPRSTTLGNFVPQASVAPQPQQTLPATATTTTPIQTASLGSTSLPATAAVTEPARPAVQAVDLGSPNAPLYPRLSSTPADADVASTHPAPDGFGPYVPYAAREGGSSYAPTPVPVQLGRASTSPELAQAEVTDVLPTAHYLPNGFSGAKRRKMEGISRPPNDGYVTPPTTNTQFTPAQQTGAPSPETYGQQYPAPEATGGNSGSAGRRRRAASPTNSGESSSQASSQTGTPLNYPSVTPPLSSQPYPALSGNASEGTPPTDADLLAKNLPPLRGSYDPNAGGGVVPAGSSQREQTEREIATIEASYSGWIGGTGVARYRSGTPGFDRLVDIEAPLEMSATVGKTMRATVVPRPVFLNSGVIDNVGFQNVPGGTVVPVLGTLRGDALTSPAQQFSSGIGGEFQLTSTNFGAAVGYTPYNFLVSNITARLQWRPGGGHITLFGDRDSVKDTQLSYAGLRDPGSISAIYSGNVWGGVISTTGGARIDIGSEKSGLYISADGGTLEGYHVLDNRKYEGTMGAYFRAHRWPGYGTLNVGGNFFAMHYDNNQRGLSYGMGGYFSPNVYFLASVPVTYTGSYGSDFHYTINGAAGIQTFQEASAAYFPLDRATQTSFNNAYYSQMSSTGLNYALNAEGSYKIADRWYTGAFLNANNSRSYNTISGGFFVRYLFKQQVDSESGPTGLFPISGFRPLRVP